MTTPEQRARKTIDQHLNTAGWHIQDYAGLNLAAARGVAVREFPLRTGFAHHLLFVDCRAIGAVEANPASTSSQRRRAAVREIQRRSARHPAGLAQLPPPLYESTGVETFFSHRNST